MADETGEAAARPTIGSLANLPTPALVLRYEGGANRIPASVLRLGPEALDRGFEPSSGVGRWPVRGLLSHLADAELVLTHRMRRQVSESRPVFTVWDPDAFIEGTVYGERGRAERLPAAGFVAVVHTLRRWTAEWLRTLGEDAWARSGLHPEAGEQTLRAQVEKATWHLEHHAWFLERKLEAMGVAKAEGPAAS
jgi:hypothetical protein